MGKSDGKPEGRAAQQELNVLSHVLDGIKDMKFGTIQIVIHDGKVVQIEKTEKYRLDCK
ncbi:YezD family protein [Paenibacillus sp. HB172176]|uniref:YezD family protein n=1 Tax=Paenibacillus sp. HB172176 TaxID=2493690 RepID=UPI00143A3525|nr:YezD family protein [Paenibacillus sp. HB172176]